MGAIPKFRPVRTGPVLLSATRRLIESYSWNPKQVLRTIKSVAGSPSDVWKLWLRT